MFRAFELKVSSLVESRLEADGVVVREDRFPGRQGRLLFVCLVAEQGRPAPRDELAKALWGEMPPATRAEALTSAGSLARMALPDPRPAGAKAPA